MKIWVKLLLGIIIGAVLALLLDADSSMATFEAISTIVTNIGRYIVFPLILFSTAVGIHELRSEKRVLIVLGRTLLYLVLTSALLAIIGTISTIIIPLERVPIEIQQEVAFDIPSFARILETVFPRNLFMVFFGSGDYLLPVFIVAILIGLNLNFDRLATRPTIQLFDSLGRVFYNVNALILEIVALGFIPLTTAFIMRILASPELALYRQLILILVIDAVLVIFVIYPILIYFLGGKKQPFVWIYGSIAGILTAAVTRDSFFSLASTIRHSHESLGVPRKIGSVSLPLFALFGKAGTAMVTGASFILIVTSYSALGITFAQVIWVMVFAFLTSFVLGPFPGLGVFVALSMLSGGFPAGYEEGYLILKPAIPVLMSFAVTIDVVTSLLATTLVAERTQMRKTIETREFI